VVDITTFKEVKKKLFNLLEMILLIGLNPSLALVVRIVLARINFSCLFLFSLNKFFWGTS
jgi:hypothetical protein